MKINNYKQLNAVHLGDLEQLLMDCNILDDYKNKQLKCKFCKIKVNDKNIYSIFKDSGTYKIICDNPLCVQSLLEIVNERKKKEVGS